MRTLKQSRGKKDSRAPFFERLEDRRLLAAFLQFPLQNRTPTTAVINSTFDHSMTAPYTANDVIVAYNGERGERQYGRQYAATVNGTALYGFRKNSNGTPFNLNGNYSGGSYLHYDGHDGYDFRTTDQASNGRIPVLAAAGGTVSWGGSTYNTMYVDHGNGYRTGYLHLYSRDVAAGTTVSAGDRIATAGDKGAAGSPHLHFNVQRLINGSWRYVDPYGWSGSGTDPYTSLTGITNENLWLSSTPSGPANNNFANRTIITGSSITTSGTNVGATKESGEPSHGGNTGGKSVWWSWTAPNSGSVNMNTNGSNFDTLLGVYTGSSVSNLTYIAGDDDAGDGLASSVTFNAVAGTPYRVAVDGYAGLSGNITLRVNLSGTGGSGFSANFDSGSVSSNGFTTASGSNATIGSGVLDINNSASADTSNYGGAQNPGTQGSVVTSNSFVVPQNGRLALDYNFLTNESTPAGSTYNDFAMINIVNGNGAVLQTLRTIDTYHSFISGTWGYNEQTGWIHDEFSLASFAGQSVRLQFVVSDRGDTAYDSGMLIDNVRVS